MNLKKMLIISKNKIYKINVSSKISFIITNSELEQIRKYGDKFINRTFVNNVKNYLLSIGDIKSFERNVLSDIMVDSLLKAGTVAQKTVGYGMLIPTLKFNEDVMNEYSRRFLKKYKQEVLKILIEYEREVYGKAS